MLGKVIRDYRKARGMKQQTLAERAHIRQSEVSEIEHGTRANLTTELINRLAAALDVPVEELIKAAAADVPTPVYDLQAQGLPEPLVQELIEVWPRLTVEDREALLAMHRAILARYRVEPATEKRNGKKTESVPHTAES